MDNALINKLNQLSQEERLALADQLKQPPEPRKRTPLNLEQATNELFIADLEPGERTKDPTFHGQTLWFKGHNHARGPQGGVYLYGRCVAGVKAKARKGMLKIASQHFQAFKQGGACECWVRFDGDDRDTLIGIMTNYREPKAK